MRPVTTQGSYVISLIEASAIKPAFNWVGANLYVFGYDFTLSSNLKENEYEQWL